MKMTQILIMIKKILKNQVRKRMIKQKIRNWALVIAIVSIKQITEPVSLSWLVKINLTPKECLNLNIELILS